MEQLVKKYADKLIQAGLGSQKGPCTPLVGGLDDDLVWNRKAEEAAILERVFNGLNINSLVFLRPKAPYDRLIQFLAENALASHLPIQPTDCETKTFFHDLPVIDRLDADQIIQVLKKRKSVIVISENENNASNRPAIIAHGSVSPEQGFVTVSSVCFTCFVKFFTDYLEDLKKGYVPETAHQLFDEVRPFIKPVPRELPSLISGPFTGDKIVYQAMIEAGKAVVACQLVDSYFGNISCCWKDTLYISQTGSSLDELGGYIDPVLLDGSSSAGITASSELSAHLKVIENTGCDTILHGHPKFCVISSMDCDPNEKAVCRFSDECHIKCPKKRFVGSIPIVPGEVGTGRYGLCHTLSRAFENRDSAIVYGHGVFTIGNNDFSEAFVRMIKAEQICREHYFKQVDQYRFRD